MPTPKVNQSEEMIAALTGALPERDTALFSVRVASVSTGGGETAAEVASTIVAEVAATLQAPRLLLMGYAPHEEKLRCFRSFGLTEPLPENYTLALSGFPQAQQALRTSQVFTLSPSDCLPDPLDFHFKGEGVVAPLSVGNRTVGLFLGLTEPGIDRRSAEWMTRLQHALERCALLMEWERIASSHEDSLRIRYSMREITAAILEGRPLSEIADAILEIVCRRLHEDRCALYLYDTGGVFQPLALRGAIGEYGEELFGLAHSGPVAARGMATGLPHTLLTEDAALAAETRQELKQQEVHSILIATLQHEETVRGAMVFYLRAERQFAPSELSVIMGFTDIAALAIALSRQIRQQRQTAMVEERNRLAREIHDTVAQSLASLVLQLETAQNCLTAEDRDGARDMLLSSRSLARATLEETRRALRGLSPESLERLSPSEAISEEVAQFENETGITTQFLAMGEERALNADQQTALLRIAQESLSNIRKHSGARRVRVGLQYNENEVALRLEDDGNGFDVAARTAPGPEGGYGLFGMSERARLVGGDLIVESTPGWGTLVRFTLPYRPVSLLPVATQTQMSLPIPEEVPVRVPPIEAALPEPAVPLQKQKSEREVSRLLLVDDHPLVRQGLKSVLEASGEIVVVGEAGDGEEAAQKALALSPDVVLMDVQMPNVDGLEGLRRIHAVQPELPVIILTTFHTDDSVREALSAGARGYLLKDVEPDNLLAAVRAVRRGEATLAPAVRKRLAALTSAPREKTPETLNERELEVLALLAKGARNKEIASQLFITTSTVEYHLSHIYEKLNVSNRTEAVRAALSRGLV